jgi:hypothetical protein
VNIFTAYRELNAYVLAGPEIFPYHSGIDRSASIRLLKIVGMALFLPASLTSRVTECSFGVCGHEQSIYRRSQHVPISIWPRENCLHCYTRWFSSKIIDAYKLGEKHWISVSNEDSEFAKVNPEQLEGD